MRTILVLAGGSETDDQAFSAALAAAKPLGAHLDFLHIRISEGESASNRPHVGFAMGPALTAALDTLRKEALHRSFAASCHFEQFCAREAIPLAANPIGAGSKAVSASWSEERPGDAVSTILLHARHSDLLVVGRATRSNGLPSNFIERVLFESGRPVLIAPTFVLDRPIGTAVVCWKETAEAARTIAMATPLLKVVPRVVLLGADDGHGGPLETIDNLAKRLGWHGVMAATRWLPADGRPAEHRLQEAITEYEAPLVVMGAYGHSRMRETILGGCTRHFLEDGSRPLLLVH